MSSSDIFDALHATSNASISAFHSSCSVVSLAFSDLIAYPDDDVDMIDDSRPRTPYADARPGSRSNAMSLEFIMSGILAADSSAAAMTTVSPIDTLLPKGAIPHAHVATAVVHSAISSLNVAHEGQPPEEVQGWAPKDGQPYVVLDPIGLPDLPFGVQMKPETSSRPTQAPTANYPFYSHTVPPMHVPASSAPRIIPSSTSGDLAHFTIPSPSTTSHADERTAADAVSTPLPTRQQYHIHISATPSFMLPPFPAALAPVRKSKSKSQSQSTPRRAPLGPADVNRRAAPPLAKRTAPPAPRGGVAPALARSITHIRMARERAQHHLSRTHSLRAGETTRTPSVLGRWPRSAGGEVLLQPAGFVGCVGGGAGSVQARPVV